MASNVWPSAISEPGAQGEAVRLDVYKLMPKISNFSAFTVAIGKQYTLLQLLGMIEELRGKKVERGFGDVREGDIQQSLVNISKAGEILDYKPMVGVQEGLSRIVR